jgi:hypothetical protein
VKTPLAGLVEDRSGRVHGSAGGRVVEEALEAEVSDALRRGYYERGSDPGRGHRNGTRTAGG